MSTWQELAARTLSTVEIRRIDERAVREFGMSSLVLMENAALHASAWLIDKFRFPPEVTILCGRGNNGGDGLAIARHLRAAGWPVKVVVIGPVETMSADAAANWHVLRASETADDCALVIPDEIAASTLEDNRTDQQVASWIRGAEVVLDAMLGTGAAGNPREPMADWIRTANAARGMRIAIDIPTGVNAETGEIGDPTFQAEVTLTFAARKRAFAMESTKPYTGDVLVLPIGIPRELIRQTLERAD